MITVLEALRRHATVAPDAIAYGEKVQGTWQTTTRRRLEEEIRGCARALMRLGLAPGARVAILAANRPEWAITCLGAAAARLVPVGIYQTCSAEQVSYIVGHAEALVVVVENLEQLAKIENVRETLPASCQVVVMRGVPAGDVPKVAGVWSWSAFMALAFEVPEAELDARLEAISSDDLASLIYTSGTTGQPKAVMLNHRNIVETCRLGQKLHDLSPRDSLVSYLPMAHIAEQMMSVHMLAYIAYRVDFLDNPLELLETLQERQPSVFFGVPRVWERVHAGMTDKLRRASAPLRAILAWATSVGRRWVEATCHGRRPTPWLAMRWRLANAVILGKIRTKIGFRDSRIAASGAAPIGREILDFFAGLGILIYEVYGLSETTGPGTWNHAGRTRLGTVGPPLPEVELRIADDGEVLFRGPNVFQGYFKSPEATAEALDEEGWFHTGDLGAVDAEGFLSITGRKKEILITSGGKNIAPAALENKLKQIDLIGDAVAIGDGRRFVAALLTLDEDAVATFIKGRQIEGPLHEAPDVLDAVRAGIRQINSQVAKVESVRNFRLLPNRLSLEAGELTPTLKIKRQIVHDRYSAEIEAMYAEGQVLTPQA